MKISFSEGMPNGDVTRIFMESLPSDADLAYQERQKAKQGHRQIFVDLVDGHRFADVHPDIRGLYILLAVAPFTAKEIDTDFAVSEGFATRVEKHLKLRFLCVDPAISPRRLAQGAGHPTLSFSGGVDSCSVLKLLPDDTKPVFLHRQWPTDEIKKTLYKDEAALHSCETVKKLGYDVKAIKTSIEHGRVPVGFPVDWSACAPIVINADVLQASSVSFGMIFEIAFGLGRLKYSHLSSRSIYRNWAPLFEYVDLPISLPSAALSEVLTSRIAIQAAHVFEPQSCMRGATGAPCMNCFKCFRKTILDAAIRGIVVSPGHYDMAYKSREVSNSLQENPIRQEIVLSWTLENSVSVDHPLFTALMAKTRVTRGYGDRLDFLTKYYPEGLEFVPERGGLRDFVRERVSHYADPVSEDEAAMITGWDKVVLMADPRYAQGAQTVAEALQAKSAAPAS
jgi:hypothetical protein